MMDMEKNLLCSQPTGLVVCKKNKKQGLTFLRKKSLREKNVQCTLNIGIEKFLCSVYTEHRN